MTSELRRFLLFLLLGGTAAFVNLASRYILSQWVSYELAVVYAYAISMVVGFSLFKWVVFDSKGDWRSQFGRFSAVNAVNFVLVWCVSVGLARLFFPAIGFTWHSEEVAHFIGVALPAFSSYFAHKHFSFAAGQAEQPR